MSNRRTTSNHAGSTGRRHHPQLLIRPISAIAIAASVLMGVLSLLFNSASIIGLHQTGLDDSYNEDGKQHFDDNDEDKASFRYRQQQSLPPFMGTNNRQCHFILQHIQRIGRKSATATTSNTIGNNNSVADSIDSVDELSSPPVHLFSFAATWKSLTPYIHQAVLDELRSFLHFPNKTMEDQMVHDVTKLLHTLTLERLRNSFVRPFRPQQIQALLTIMYNRLVIQHNPDEDEDDDESSSPPPLTILVTGGSAAEGVGNEYNPYGASRKSGGGTMAWPRQFERLVNGVLFHGTKSEMVHVVNVASGGCTSDVGAMFLRYRTWPSSEFAAGVDYPHIIINAHTMNDFGQMESRKGFMEDYIQAANELQPCLPESTKNTTINDDNDMSQTDATTSTTTTTDLPAVWMVDEVMARWGVKDVLGKTLELSDYSQLVAQLAHWYQVGALSVGNALRHVTIQQDAFMMDGEELISRMWADHLHIHPGAVYHSTLPVILLFNLLRYILTWCSDHDENEISHNHEQDDTISKNKKKGYAQPLSIKAMPQLKDYATEEDDSSSLSVVASSPLLNEWTNRQAHLHQLCTALADISSNSSDTNPCSYQWMTNKMVGGARKKRDVRIYMEQIMVSNDGWLEEGFPIRKPRPGWVAMKAGAEFVTEIKADRIPIRYMTFLSMVSYGTKWKDSRLRVTMEVIPSSSSAPESISNNNKTVSEVSGVHDEPFSVLHPHSFEVPNGGAAVGDTVRTTFTLIGGTTFRIQGLMFCIVH